MIDQRREETTGKVWAIINALPQREAIVEGDARHWVDHVVGEYAELATWHAIRAGGFGGSQIGALVRNHHGQRADHSSARDIVAGALLRKVPDEPNGQMRRGVDMEPYHRDCFLKKFSAHRDEEGFKALSKGVGPRPWMRYSPDELCFMPAEDGKLVRVLGDYKAPTQVDPRAEVSFQYGCQLHMGRMVAEHNGVGVDRMVLSQFDWANWQTKEDFVEYVPGLDELIVKAGDYFWDYVLRGELPPYVFKKRVEQVPQVVQDLAEPAMRLARLKATVKALEKHVEVLERDVKPVLQTFRLGDTKLQIGGLTVTAVPKLDAEKAKAMLPEEVLAAIPLRANSTKQYDEDAMKRALKALNVDTKQFMKVGSLDANGLYEACVAHGVDADDMAAEQLRMAIDPKLQQQVDAQVEREFDHLIHAPVVDEVDHEGETNDREGHETPRSVPRSVMA